MVNKLPPLLDCVLALHDGEYHVFDYALYSTEQLMGDVGTAIGVNPVRAPPSSSHAQPCLAAASSCVACCRWTTLPSLSLRTRA